MFLVRRMFTPQKDSNLQYGIYVSFELPSSELFNRLMPENQRALLQQGYKEGEDVITYKMHLDLNDPIAKAAISERERFLCRLKD
jgi:hypothetical protein